MYDAEVRPTLEAMSHASAAMDDLMAGHGAGATADMRCVAWRMMDNLDHHRLLACASQDMHANRTEAVEHAETMMARRTPGAVAQDVRQQRREASSSRGR